MFCPECGVRNEDWSRFCQGCGMGLADAAPPAGMAGNPVNQARRPSRKALFIGGALVLLGVLVIVGWRYLPFAGKSPSDVVRSAHEALQEGNVVDLEDMKCPDDRGDGIKIQEAKIFTERMADMAANNGWGAKDERELSIVKEEITGQTASVTFTLGSVTEPDWNNDYSDYELRENERQYTQPLLKIDGQWCLTN